MMKPPLKKALPKVPRALLVEGAKHLTDVLITMNQSQVHIRLVVRKTGVFVVGAIGGKSVEHQLPFGVIEWRRVAQVLIDKVNGGVEKPATVH